MEWLEISADSVNEAKEQALMHLGVHESDAEFEVLSEGRVGMFGRVKEEARVRARVVPTPVRPKEGRSRGNSPGRRGSGGSSRSSTKTPSEASAKSPKESQPARRAQRNQPAQQSAAASTPAASADSGRAPRKPRNTRKEDASAMMHDNNSGPSLVEQADIAESFVRGIGDNLGFELEFRRSDVENGILRIEANGEGVGLLVGRRGTTAHAIDELVRTVLQRSGGTTRDGRIRMDIGGIRRRRAESLATFAEQVAAEVIAAGEDIALEPMNRIDRKIVHDAVARIDQATSRSEGEDPHRRVVIGVNAS